MPVHTSTFTEFHPRCVVLFGIITPAQVLVIITKLRSGREVQVRATRARNQRSNVQRSRKKSAMLKNLKGGVKRGYFLEAWDHALKDRYGTNFRPG